VDYSFECIGNVNTMRAALECAHRGWGQRQDRSSGDAGAYSPMCDNGGFAAVSLAWPRPGQRSRPAPSSSSPVACGAALPLVACGDARSCPCLWIDTCRGR
jgi:hypothetical protein